MEIKRESVQLLLSADQLAHVLLSDLRRLTAIQDKLQVNDPFEKLVAELSGTGEELNLKVDINWAVLRKMVDALAMSEQ